MTSRMFSTTQMVCLSLEESWQMLHKSKSEMLLHLGQNRTSLRILAIASLKARVTSSSSFNKCNTILNAVFLPMPGNWAQALTASSINLEEKIMLGISVCASYKVTKAVWQQENLNLLYFIHFH